VLSEPFGGGRVDVAVEVVRDSSSGVPAAHRHLSRPLPALVAGRQGRHQHHATSPQALLGGWQADPREVGDLAHREALRVVEDDRRAVDRREADECVFQLHPRLRREDDFGGIDGVVVGTPALLDVSDRDLTIAARAVDGQVVDHPTHPGVDPAYLGELDPVLVCPHHRLLGEILRERVVPGDGAGEAYERGPVGEQNLTGRLVVGWRPRVLRHASIVVRPAAARGLGRSTLRRRGRAGRIPRRP